MTITSPPPETGERGPIDDYHVQADPGRLTQPATHHVLGVLNIVLLLILAAVSFALFWVVATLLELL